MFSNFVYFIVALITLSLYQSPRAPALKPLESLVVFMGIIVLFAMQTRHRFKTLARRATIDSMRSLDQRFSKLVTQHSILALAIFAVDIWVLDLPAYIQSWKLFTIMPTMKDLLFLMLFVGYLIIVWYYSYDAHAPIYKSDITRSTYVNSNFAFSVPILLPWVLLFTVSDLLILLPFDWLKTLLNSDIGQIVYFLLFLLVAAVFAPVLIQRFWHCRPLEHGPVRQRIVMLCQRAGINYADIVYWPIFGGRMITAAVMGLIGRFRYILVTDALLRLLTSEEVDQVIAHEIGHVKRRHLLLYLLFFIGFMLVSYAIVPLSYLFLYFSRPVLQLQLDLSLNPNDLIHPLQSTLLVVSIVIYFRFAFGFFIRNFERQADLYVFRLFPSSMPLISTFGKIVASSGQPADKPNWHHFSIQERVDYLKLCENDSSWISRHDRKVRFSIYIFITGLLMLTAGVFYLNQVVFSQNQQKIAISAIEIYLGNKEIKTPQDAVLYEWLGNSYLASNNSAKAVRAYEQGLSLDPDLPELLNNLSWVLSTSKDDTIRNAERALALAQRAIALEKAPHIWDTLAEALYANGHIEEAVAAEEQALSMHPDDRETYEKQLERFKKGLNE